LHKISEVKNARKGWSMAQVVKHLSSYPSMKKKKEGRKGATKEERKEGRKMLEQQNIPCPHPPPPLPNSVKLFESNVIFVSLHMIWGECIKTIKNCKDPKLKGKQK
jgi:hypothetical protein